MTYINKLEQRRKQRTVLSCLAMSLVGLFGSQALAESVDDWPQRPISLLVGYVPGGTTDSTARIVAEQLTAKLGQAVVVENKAGANSNIAADYAARAKPDGYTLLVATASNAINPSLPTKARYSLEKSFEPVSFICSVPDILVVPLDPPIKTLKQYAEYVKQHPGSMTFGSPGIGSSVHLAGELFQQVTGSEMRHVPYRGSSAAVTDLISGRIGSMFDNLPTALAQIRGGKVRPLAVATLERTPALPDVPTFDESGYPGFEAYSWTSIVAPAGTPAPIVKKINLAMKEILADPETRERLVQLGTVPVYMTTDKFGDFIKNEISKWAGVVKKIDPKTLE